MRSNDYEKICNQEQTLGKHFLSGNYAALLSNQPLSQEQQRTQDHPAKDQAVYEHEDWFLYLGIHQVCKQWVVRTYHTNNTATHVIDPSTLNNIASSLIFNENGLKVFLLDNQPTNTAPKYQLLKQAETNPSWDPYAFPPFLSAFTRHLWSSGQLFEGYKDLGAHPWQTDQAKGWLFRVCAPQAKRVALVGDWNGWNDKVHSLRFFADAGIWEIFIPQELYGQKYKYSIVDQQGQTCLKADPFAHEMEHPPKNACVVKPIATIDWADKPWIKKKEQQNWQTSPISVYEVHLGSWRKKFGRFFSYQEAETELVTYVKDMGFTHVEFMPLSEYPLDASWGYQPIGLFAPSIRFGTAQELQYLINEFHRAGIGVIMDWVPAHFPLDEHGLKKFDGTYLFEYEDKRKGYHPDWHTGIFNYSRYEVINYLISNALYWFENFHIDGMRVDAVSSMLYWSYSRLPGEWEPNQYGTAENLEAIAFLKLLNKTIKTRFPNALMIAEESTMFSGVTTSLEKQGLGFDLKWNLGWMHDSLEYIMAEESEKRQKHHQITHCIDYAFQEKFLLPLSHDEVVHGKSALLGKMPGYDEQKFSLLKCYFAYQWAHPGKKLLFMGNEWAQRKEWQFAEELEWHLLQYKPHQGVQKLIKALNSLYQTYPEMYQTDFIENSFEWIKKDSINEAVFAFIRQLASPKNDQTSETAKNQEILFIFNFSDQNYSDLNFGVSHPGTYELLLNTEWQSFSGSVLQSKLELVSTNQSWDGKFHSIKVPIAAKSAMWLRYKNAD